MISIFSLTRRCHNHDKQKMLNRRKHILSIVLLYLHVIFNSNDALQSLLDNAELHPQVDDEESAIAPPHRGIMIPRVELHPHRDAISSTSSQSLWQSQENIGSHMSENFWFDIQQKVSNNVVCL